MKNLSGIWKEESGYFTIEAVFLVTIIFSIACTVILTGLYICDLNQAKSFLNRRVTELSSNGEEYGSGDESEDRSRIKKQLFVTNLTDFSISKTEQKVKGSIVLSMKLSVPFIEEWFGGLWTDRFSLTVDVGDNADMMRRWEQIE